MKRYGNYIEGISKNKLYKMGYRQYVSYWSDRISQQNLLQAILKGLSSIDYLYTQKKDKTGLFHIIVYIKDK